MSIRRGTTPTITLRLKGEITFDHCTLYITFKQDGLLITKSNKDVEIILPEPTVKEKDKKTRLKVFFTQEETLSFKKGDCEVQIRWIDSSDLAYGTPIKRIKIDPILLEGVITYVASGS